MDIYGTYRFKVENPRVAICDYLENGVVDEFHIFAEKFREPAWNASWPTCASLASTARC